jgi:hypothetical protein
VRPKGTKKRSLIELHPVPVKLVNVQIGSTIYQASKGEHEGAAFEGTGFR